MGVRKVGCCAASKGGNNPKTTVKVNLNLAEERRVFMAASEIVI
jgi:hypothetical protein